MHTHSRHASHRSSFVRRSVGCSTSRSPSSKAAHVPSACVSSRASTRHGGAVRGLRRGWRKASHVRGLQHRTLLQQRLPARGVEGAQGVLPRRRRAAGDTGPSRRCGRRRRAAGSARALCGRARFAGALRTGATDDGAPAAGGEGGCAVGHARVRRLRSRLWHSGALPRRAGRGRERGRHLRGPVRRSEGRQPGELCARVLQRLRCRRASRHSARAAALHRGRPARNRLLGRAAGVRAVLYLLGRGVQLPVWRPRAPAARGDTPK